MRKTVISFLVVITLVIGYIAVYMATDTWTNPITVISSERVTSHKTSRYLVYSESEVFENTDSLLFGKWSSADYHARIKAGQTYRFRVVGWRLSFLSWHRNIIDYERR